MTTWNDTVFIDSWTFNYSLCKKRKGEDEEEEEDDKSDDESELGREESGVGTVHVGTCPEVPQLDAGSCASRSYWIWAVESGAGVWDANLLDSRSQ